MLRRSKIANPAMPVRIPQDDLVALMPGYDPVIASGHDRAAARQHLAAALGEGIERIALIHRKARAGSVKTCARRVR